MSLNDELLTAAAAGDYNKVRNLVDKGADINISDNHKQSPLHYASYSGYLDITKYLLDKGADVKAKDKDGNTPLHNAIRSDNYKLAVIECLIKKGADSNARDNNGNTPLHIAARFSTLEVVKYLIGQGADMMAKGSMNHTPLHFAVLNSNLEIVQYFLEKGADVNVADNSGLTSLHLAAGHSSNLEIVRSLIKRNTDVSAKDNKGRTPLDIAKIECSNCKDIIDLLKEKSTSSVRHDVQNTTEFINPETPLTLAKETCLGTGCAGNSTSRVRRDVQYTTEFINPETSFDWIQGKVANVLTTEATNSSNLLQVDPNSTMSLLDIIIRKFTGQKLVPTATDTGFSEKQRLGYTLSINDNFEKAVRYAAKESGIPIRSLDVDFFKVFEEIYTNIDSGKFYQIPEVLSSYAKKACIDEQIGTQKCNKFIDAFEKKLSIENILIMLTSYREADDISDHIIQPGVFNLGNENSPQSHLENVSISSGNITQAKAQDLIRRG